jgi:hypothetical protein
MIGGAKSASAAPAATPFVNARRLIRRSILETKAVFWCFADIVFSSVS